VAGTTLDRKEGATMHARTRVQPPADHPLHDLDRHLDTWTKEHLISREEAGSIRAYEASQVARPERRKTAAPPVTEALAYLGGALAIAAVGVVLGRSWSDMPTWVRIAIPGVIALALLALGWLTKRSSDTAVGRLSHVAWFFSTGAVAWCVAELTIDGLDLADRWPLLWTGVATSAYAGVLYATRPGALQHVALLAGLGMLAGGALFDSAVAAWSVIWTLGLAWVVLGWRRVLAGPETATTIGTVVALISALVVPANAGAGLMWLAVVNAAALIGAAVALRHTPMLVLAAVGLFEGTIATIDHYLGGGLGAAVGLFVAGVAVLAVALVVSRRRRPRAVG
jgi:hypothetical protein